MRAALQGPAEEPAAAEPAAARAELEAQAQELARELELAQARKFTRRPVPRNQSFPVSGNWFHSTRHTTAELTMRGSTEPRIAN